MHLVMGTAGHVDHGKTALIKALTGIDCDRLAEEKARGITIELGFAHLDLEGVGRVGIVDVPGHERFVKNMVSGAAGMDFVLLVVAADEGVMPQTREHLDICRLLDIRHGLVAVTKTDAVDQELLDMAVEDVRAYLEGSFLEDAPLVPVSARTGQGLDELKVALAQVVAKVAERGQTGLFRLPVDRAFIMKGFGTVVTGTCMGGHLAVGDQVRVYPGDAVARVRGLQSHGLELEEVGGGNRVAVNLAGLDRDKVGRGDVLARPGTLFPEQSWELELTCLESSPRSLKQRREVHFHHGSRETLARLSFLDRDELKPGETAVCQVRFAEPLAGVFDDRVVVRAFSPLRTVAGGRVLSPLSRRVKRFSDQVDLVRGLAGADAETVAGLQLVRAGAEGLDLDRLAICLDLDAKRARKVLDSVASRGKALLTDRDAARFHAASVVAELEDGLEAFVAAYHKKNPSHPGVPRGQALSGWGKGLPEGLGGYVLERLHKQARLAQGDVQGADVVRLADHQVSLAADQSELRFILLDAYSKAGTAPPKAKVLLEELGVSMPAAADVFRILVEQGELVRVDEEFYFHAPALKAIEDKLVAYFQDNEELTAPQFKDLTGLTRKHLIPLLEHFDRKRLTVRVGDVRRFRHSGRS